MSTTAQNLANALRAEFQLMNDQVYPYVENTKACVIVNITNTSTITKTITPTMMLEFDALGYTYPEKFYPKISAPIDLNPATQYTTAGEATILFESTYSGQITVPDTANAKLYDNGTQVIGIAIDRTPVIDAEHESLYYFVYRMTQILMDRINAANIYDPDQGDENPGAGYLTVDFTMMKSAFVYGWANILYMEEHPSTSNGPIINSIDTYLDKLTGNYFYATIHYSHNSVSGMTSNACSALDNINLNTSMADATTLSAELMADIVDYYCNGELS